MPSGAKSFRRSAPENVVCSAAPSASPRRPNPTFPYAKCVPGSAGRSKHSRNVFHSASEYVAPLRQETQLVGIHGYPALYVARCTSCTCLPAKDRK